MNEKDDKFLISHAHDKCRECSMRNIPSATGFLDLKQQSVLLKERYASEPVFYGGYEGAERQILMFLPDYMNLPEDAEEIKLMEVISSAPLSHRDCLGALMSLGIKRENIGDIVIDGKRAYIFIKSAIENFLLSNFTRARKSELMCKIIPLSDFRCTFQSSEYITKTASSPRLDSVIGALFNMSRAKSQEFIAAGKVFINHMEATKPEKTIKNGDRITLRTKGKVHITEIGELTKKGRIKITAEIFV